MSSEFETVPIIPRIGDSHSPVNTPSIDVFGNPKAQPVATNKSAASTASAAHGHSASAAVGAVGAAGAVGTAGAAVAHPQAFMNSFSTRDYVMGGIILILVVVIVVLLVYFLTKKQTTKAQTSGAAATPQGTTPAAGAVSGVASAAASPTNAASATAGAAAEMRDIAAKPFKPRSATSEPETLIEPNTPAADVPPEDSDAMPQSEDTDSTTIDAIEAPAAPLASQCAMSPSEETPSQNTPATPKRRRKSGSN